MVEEQLVLGGQTPLESSLKKNVCGTCGKNPKDMFFDVWLQLDQFAPFTRLVIRKHFLHNVEIGIARELMRFPMYRLTLKPTIFDTHALRARLELFGCCGLPPT